MTTTESTETTPTTTETPGQTTSLPESTWNHHHLLDLDDCSRTEIETVLTLADRMREILDRRIPRVPALRGFTVVNLFYEPSTRTRASFELAGKVLGADVISVNSSTSSIQKGESLIDTVRTMRAMRTDAIVIRHAMAGAPYLAAEHTDASIINAGDGAHAHPTQALLDLYTMRRHVGDLSGKKVVMVGDIAHSRVARSDLWGLAAMGAKVVVCGPPTLLPLGLRAQDRPGHAESALPPVSIETNIDVALEGADVVIALRLQSERQEAGLLPSLHEYAANYQVTAERLVRAKPDHLLMHPGPKNEGIEIAGDVASGDRSIIEEQVTNGVAVRMALLYLLSGRVDPSEVVAEART
ncbi:MAG: aspartate carbamoyltransferase catalytic subunit [Dehalococcoidia bacterium]|jgi:aspartate carbamoyltransferase catalytic subunit|nr:aspartate carbamoyltransferase catalytic subunit [Dehalococcoidia bacterium]